jgi:ribosome-associated protein
MDDTVNNDASAEYSVLLAQLLDDHRCEDTRVLDVRGICSWANFFVITTVSSQGHLRGTVRHVRDFLSEHDLQILHNHKRVPEQGWVLLDCGTIVIHLMDRETREFYELERLWFNGTEVFQSSKSS